MAKKKPATPLSVASGAVIVGGDSRPPAPSVPRPCHLRLARLTLAAAARAQRLRACSVARCREALPPAPRSANDAAARAQRCGYGPHTSHGVRPSVLCSGVCAGNAQNAHPVCQRSGPPCGISPPPPAAQRRDKRVTALRRWPAFLVPVLTTQRMHTRTHAHTHTRTMPPPAGGTCRAVRHPGPAGTGGV